jgi:hypothetical protein
LFLCKKEKDEKWGFGKTEKDLQVFETNSNKFEIDLKGLSLNSNRGGVEK